MQVVLFVSLTALADSAVSYSPSLTLVFSSSDSHTVLVQSYLVVMSYPRISVEFEPPYIANATITTFLKTTGKVKHSFTRPDLNTFMGELAIVPPKPAPAQKPT